MAERLWWQRARLREDEGHSRRVGWVELFYDLVFVVVIAEVAHALSAHVSWAGLGAFLLTFVPLWWTWIGGTIYAERFESEDVSFRVFAFLQMLPIAGMAVFAHDALGHGAQGFALSYAAGRLLIILLWLRGGWHDARARPVTNRFAVGFTASFALFVASAFLHGPIVFVLWGIGLAFDIATPLFTLRQQAKLPRLSAHKLPERFGLLVIIVLGEMVVQTIQGVAQNELRSLRTFAAGALGMALVFLLWWLYFDAVQRKGPKPALRYALARSYLHLPLLLGLTAMSAGLFHVVVQEGRPTLPTGVRWLLAGGAALAILSCAAFQLVLQHGRERAFATRLARSMMLAAAACVAIGALGGALGPTRVLAALALTLAALIGWGATLWFRGGYADGAAEGAPDAGHA